MEFPLVHNQKENCHYDDTPFMLKEITNLFRWMYISIANKPVTIVANEVNEPSWAKLELAVLWENVKLLQMYA